MGSFFTSTQIYAPSQHSKDQFLDIFCKEMKDEGYVICDSDESEISYILKFIDNCKWVIITSETYEQGNQLSRQDASRIAKILKTICINITVIDSDCAIMDLYNENGKKADSLIMGRAGDYFGDDIPQPSENVWSQFLSNGIKWEQFIEICNAEEVFIDESLSKLAEAIGMNNENILFSAEDAQEDKQTVFLSFRNTREKKLTVKAAFIKVFGEALEPLGYKKVKGANPYFVRVIDSEIIHVITFVTDSTAPGYKAFEICGDVRSIYSSNNYFSKKPEDAYSESYFDLSNFRVYSYRLHHEDYDFDYQRKISRFLCKDDSASIISEMNEALDTSQKILLPFINSIDSIDKLFKYLFQYHPSSLYNRQELLFLRIGNYSEVISDIRRNVNDVYLKCVELKREGYMEEEYKRRISKADQVDQRRRDAIKEVRDNPKQYAEYKKMEKEAKEGTIMVLKKCGII